MYTLYTNIYILYSSTNWGSISEITPKNALSRAKMLVIGMKSGTHASIVEVNNEMTVMKNNIYSKQ